MFTILRFKPMLAIILSVTMSHVPEIASAELAPKMVGTQEAVEQTTRAEAEARVRVQLDREDVQLELEKYGVTAEEAKKRLASLSDSELRQVAAQMDQAQYGGVIGVLLIVVLVLLIIYLARKI